MPGGTLNYNHTAVYEARSVSAICSALLKPGGFDEANQQSTGVLSDSSHTKPGSNSLRAAATGLPLTVLNALCELSECYIKC